MKNYGIVYGKCGGRRRGNFWKFAAFAVLALWLCVLGIGCVRAVAGAEESGIRTGKNGGEAGGR